MNAGDMDKLHDELIAYLGGELGPEERIRVEREIDSSAAARAEFEWLRAACSDIETIERGSRQTAPDIDIVESVMQSVRKASAPQDAVSLDAVRAGRRVWWPGLAAAAAILVGTGYVIFRSTDTPATDPAHNGTTANVRPVNPTVPPQPESGTSLAESRERLDKKRNELGHATDPDTERLVLTQGPRIELPAGVADVVEARRDAATSGASMDRLLEWARLTRKNALDVANAPDASPKALLGAAESLYGDDQRQVLLTAVGKLQEDPNGRLQLARNYLEDPAEEPAAAAENKAEAVAQLSDLKNADPENALPYYYEAKVQLGAGDTQSALASLQAAGDLSKASAYSLESALAQLEALTAGGMDPDAARMVAALTAGMDENKFLCQLAADLLDYGQGFLSENDTATATAIGTAVEQLGRQVEEGASLSQEQLAGMDIQRQALGLLGQLYTTVESAEGVASVTEATNALTIRVEDLAGFFNALDELFLKPMTTGFWDMVSGIILGSGDISLFTNPGVVSATPPTTTP